MQNAVTRSTVSALTASDEYAVSDPKPSRRTRRSEAKSRVRSAPNDEVVALLNHPSTIICEEACAEVRRRRIFKELSNAILAGEFTRAKGRICAANAFTDRVAALIGFDALLDMFRAEKVPEVLSNTLLVLVCVRHRMDDVKKAIYEVKSRFPDAETTKDLARAERSLQTGRIRDFSEFYRPDPSFGFRE